MERHIKGKSVHSSKKKKKKLSKFTSSDIERYMKKKIRKKVYTVAKSYVILPTFERISFLNKSTFGNDLVDTGNLFQNLIAL